MNKLIALIFVFISIVGIAQKETIRPQDIPNVKVLSNKNFYDQSNKVAADKAELINLQLSKIETEMGYPIAVVLLNSIDNQDPHKFALDLFNYWGIGSAQANNGLLMMIVLDVRRTEFITGTGIEGILPDALCFKIQNVRMNPKFKEGNFFDGILGGIMAVEDIYRRNPAEYLNKTQQQIVEETPVSKEELKNSGGYNWFFITLFYDGIYYYVLAILACLALCIVVFLFSFTTTNLETKYKIYKFGTIRFFGIFFPIPFLFLRPLIFKLMNTIRYRTRYSPKTGKPLHLLSEMDENDFLSKVQIAKENIGSYDYDVWVSYDMEEFVIIPYKTWFKSVRKCPKCRERTYILKSNRVLVSASYSSSGKGEKTYKCESCNHKRVKTYTIPRKSPPSSGSSSYSSSSISSGSSGGSWGGGSSSGGGAGSSW